MIEQLIGSLGNLFGLGIAGVIKAILIFVLAMVLACIAKDAAMLGIMKLPWFKGKDNSLEISEFFGRLVSLSVILLFIPGICSSLGASSIADPILDMLRKLWAFIPNVIGACILLALGYHVARLIRQLLAPCVEKLVPKVLEGRVKYEEADIHKVSETVSYVGYIAVLVPSAIGALQVLELDSLTKPAVLMLQRILAFIPNLLASVIILAIGFILAKTFGRLVETMVAAAGLDEKVSRFANKDKDFHISRVIGKMVHLLVVTFFVVEALHALKMDVLTAIGKAIIGYLPNVVAAVVIVLLAWMAAGATTRVFQTSGFACGKWITKSIIYVIAGFMVLSQLSIAPYIVNAAFIMLIFGVSIAFAISFGFGAKEVVRDYLQRKINGCACHKEEVKTDEHKEETEDKGE